MPLLELTHDWGDVTEESSSVRSRLALNAPAPVAMEVDGVSVHYTASLNGEQLLETDDKTVSLSESGTEVAMNATLRHDDIPAWWAGHVARGERSELAVEPAVEVGGGIASASVATPTIRGEVDSHVLDKIQGIAGALADELAGLQRRIFGRALLVPVDATAAWVVADDETTGRTGAATTGGARHDADGDARDADGDETADEGAAVIRSDGDVGAGNATAVRIAIQLRNGLGFRFPATPIGRFLLSRLGFRLVMNDVEMGEALLDDVVSVPSGEQRTYTVTIPLDDDALKRWWASHVDDGEETTVEIDVVADLGFGGRLRRVLHRYSERLSTDILSAVSIGS